jgi:hypothetical protein
MKYNKFFHFLSFVLTLPFLGCGDKNMATPDGFPKLFPCELTITQNGAPLAEASVQLSPDDGGKNWAAGGNTDSTGKVAIYTYGKWEGAPAGKFKVIVSKIISDPSKFTPPAEETGPARDKYDENVSNEVLNSYQTVEKQYTVPNTTPLTIEITAACTQTFDVGKTVKDRL